MTGGRDIWMVAALAASLAAGPVMAGPIYNVKDLGTLGGGSSSAFAINGGGQTAGVSSTPGEVNRRHLPARLGKHSSVSSPPSYSSVVSSFGWSRCLSRFLLRLGIHSIMGRWRQVAWVSAFLSVAA